MKIIQKHWKDVTGWAASHLDWLAKTLEDCRFAESPILAATVETLIDEMAEADDVLNGVPITYNPSFIEILKERGLKVPLREKEIEPVEDTSEDAELSDEAKHAVSPSEVGE